MTIEEINALDSHPYQDQMRERVLKKREIPPTAPEGDYDYWEWLRTEVSESELEAEFLIFKQELLDAENERLRKEDFRNRINAIEDLSGSFHSIHNDIPNHAKFLKDLEDHHDHEYVESIISALESKDAELKTQKINEGKIQAKKKMGGSVRLICAELLDMVAANNIEKSLTGEQIDQMELDYSDILKALQNNRPAKAKDLIVAMDPDGTLVTMDDKAEYLAEFSKHGI